MLSLEAASVYGQCTCVRGGAEMCRLLCLNHHLDDHAFHAKPRLSNDRDGCSATQHGLVNKKKKDDQVAL